MKEFDVAFIPGASCPPFEYFCFGCGQIRLSYVQTAECSNCKTRITNKGEPNELDLSSLRKDYESRKE